MTDKKNILIITILFILISIFFYLKTGNFLIDFSRESYIPYQLKENKTLIKDIFLIYGAFGYIINSILYSIKINLNLLIIEAHIISYLICILFYFILNKFFAKKLSCVLTIIFLLTSIFSNSTFSFVLPYSYSTLWGVFGAYLALFSLLYSKNKLLFLSLGLIFVSKIEYFIPIFLISIFYLIYRKEKLTKDWLFILIFPSFCLIYFLINKIEFIDIQKNFFYIKEMLKSNSLSYLYKGLGCYFNFDYFKYNLLLTIKTFFIFLISFILYKFKKPICSYIALIILLCFINTNFAFNLAGFLAIILTILNIRKKTITKEEILLFAFSITLCSKSIFATNSLNYANFGYCLIIYYIYLQIQKNIDKKWLINSLILFFILNFMGNLGYFLTNKKEKFKTVIGNLYINKNEIKLFKSTNKFIEKNIKQNETFIVLPEGQIFNLIHKKPYNYYNSTFTPLDFETFKEENMIKNLQKNKTDYIIFYPRNTQDYGKNTICYDYAVDFCKYIIDNYRQVANIKDGNNVLIFKIKK